MSPQRLILNTCAFFLLTASLYSQSFSVSGTINNESTEPIVYANIVVLTVADSSAVTGSISDDFGRFTINNIPSGNYLLKASYLGFKDSWQSIDLSKDLDLGIIVLSEELQSLSEVSIIGTKPTLKRESDRLIFNVEKTSLTEGSVWNILKSTPGVLMINDEISVKNASNIIYLINEKRVYLSGLELQQLLAGTSASSVQSIEVITNPPVKYDAEGGAVINIKMSKGIIAGYNGSVYGNYTQGFYPRSSVGTNHYFRGKKTSFYIGYNYNAEKLERTNDEQINFIESEEIVGNWDTDIRRLTSSNTHTANLNFEYNINDKNTLSVSANGLLTPYWERETNSFTQAIDSTFRSVNNTDDDLLNIGANLDYNYKSANGSSLSLNAHHTTYNYDRFQDVNTIYRSQGFFLRSNSFETLSEQDVKIYSGQMDVSIPFLDGGTLETGVKFSKIDSNSDIDQMLTGFSIQDQGIETTDIFDYNENNYAAYLGIGKDWGKWSVSAGVRTEYTDAVGRLSSETGENAFDYLKFFPNGNITHRFNDSHSLGLSYNKRIERPTYASLNPFQFFLNDNAYFIGNPNLQPTISQLSTLSYSVNDEFTFEVYYRSEENTFSELSFQDNNLNRIFYQASNLKEEVDYGFDFSMYKTLSRGWTAYALTSIFNVENQFFAAQTDNSIQTNERWSFYGNLINYFNLSSNNSLSATISLLYISPVISGSAEVSSRSQMNASIKKSFSDGKWVLSLEASDIFQGSDYTITNDYLDQDNSYYALFDNRWIRLGLRYNFGNTKLSAEQEIKDLDERNRLEKVNN